VPSGGKSKTGIFGALKSPDEAYQFLLLKLTGVIQQQVKIKFLNFSRQPCCPYNTYFLSQEKFRCLYYSQPDSKSV